MDEIDVESLLGAYALDAVSPEEAAEIESHLRTCPRCRAELAAHREVAALLASGGGEAPAGVWDRIAHEIGGEDQRGDVAPVRLLEALQSNGAKSRRRRRLLLPLGLVAAVLAAVLGVVTAQLSHLNAEVHQYQSIARQGGIAPAVASVLSGQHRTVVLTSVASKRHGTVAVAPDGQAYWVGSNLGQLQPGSTYQLWALADGRVVSLGVLGVDPSAYSAFRIQQDMSELMVTIEPEGGTSKPTTPVLLSGRVSL